MILAGIPRPLALSSFAPLAALAAVALASACQGEEALPQATLIPDEGTTPALTSTPLTPPPPSASPQASLPRAVEVVQVDLAAHLGVPVATIEVVQVEEVVWPDTCLGLPAPELCAPGETPGYRVVLRALGQEYRYHTDESETFRYAGPGDAPQPPQ